MSSQGQRTSERKYAQLPRSSLRLMLGTVSQQKFSDDIVSLLAENCNYFLRQTVHYAAQFMCHSGRSKLTTEDMNKALKWTNAHPIYGHTFAEPATYERVEDVFVPEDSEVDLLAMANETEMFNTLPHPSLNVQWVSLGGVPKSVAEPIPGKSSQSAPSHVIKIVDQKRRNTDEKISALSENLVTYYNHMTSAVLSEDEVLVKTALNDLCTNTKICPLLPHFTNFIAEGVRTLGQDLKHMRQLLLVIQALMQNPSMYLGHETYLNVLVQSVLYCIVEPQEMSTEVAKDHWGLRNFAANVLVQIINKWASTVNSLYEHTMSTLETVFKDLRKPFWSHYGAVVAISAFGADAIEEGLYPYMHRHMEHLDQFLSSCSRDAGRRREEAGRVYGALLLAAELYLRSRIKEEFGENSLNSAEMFFSKSIGDDLPATVPVLQWGGKVLSRDRERSKAQTKSAFEVYREFYGYFGDSLAARLPFIHVKFLFRPNLVQLYDNNKNLQEFEYIFEQPSAASTSDCDAGEQVAEQHLFGVWSTAAEKCGGNSGSGGDEDSPLVADASEINSNDHMNGERHISYAGSTAAEECGGSSGAGGDEDIECDDEECYEEESEEESDAESDDHDTDRFGLQVKPTSSDQSAGLKLKIVKVKKN